MFFSSPDLAMSRRRLAVWTWATYTVVFLLALWACMPRITLCLNQWNDNRSPSWVGSLPDKAKPGEKVCDVDTRLIHIGFVSAPHLRDTTRWLTGIWVGQVPFYRPLTSYLFWTQWRCWGDFEARYHLVAVALHLLAVLALARLALKLFVFYKVPLPFWGTLLMAALFVDGLGVFGSQATIAGETLSLWKNQPDSLTLLFFCLCLTAYLRQKAVPGGRWRVSAPIFWYVLLCLTKEAGIFLPLLLPIIEAPELRAQTTRRDAVRRMLPLIVLLPVYFGLRAVFLHDPVGYRYGSNSAWGFRLAGNVAAGFSQAVVLQDAPVVAISLSLCAWVLYFGWLAHRGKMARWRDMRPLELLRIIAVLLGTWVVAALVVAWQQVPLLGTFEPVAAATQLFLVVPLRNGAAAAVFLLCAGRAIRQRPVFGMLCYGWALMTLGLTLFSPSVLHRYYLMNAGFAVLVGGGAMLWVAPLVERVRQRVQQAGPQIDQGI